MAIGQTMSSNPSDWLSQSYHTDFFNFSQTENPRATVAVGGATTSAASRSNNLSPDQGRVMKPLRRRSRASRRTPTTLLSTDTANFRAMVQRFTGGPDAGFQVPNAGGGALNFMEHTAATSGAGAAPGPASSGFHVQYPNQEQQQHMMFMMGGGSAVAPSGSASGNENRSYENYML